MDETTPASAEREIVERPAEIVASRPAQPLPVSRVRSALVTARRLARHPAVLASASAIGAVAAREGVALARRVATREVARPAQQPVLVIVNVVYSVHLHSVHHHWTPRPLLPPGG